MSGAIRTWQDLTEDLELSCDVCIVGSGAGGAVLAAGLAAGGLDVVVLEAGSHLTREDFTLHEREAYPALYQDRGTRQTADQAITVLQGRSVGGTTTINWTTCFRTPQRIRDHWAAVHGLGDLDLDPHFEAVEERLNIHTWPEALANANNQTLQRGAEALGWEVTPLRRNVKGCANSGYCGLGCPVDGKQAMGITYIPDAVADGARIFANVAVQRLVHDGGRVTEVQGQVQGPTSPAPDGPKVTVRAKVVVSSGGAINGPALLLASGIDRGGLVGRRTFIHPVVAVVGQYAERIAAFYGAPQSMGSHEFVDRGPGKVGYFLEAGPLQPMLAAVAFNRHGPGLHDLMRTLPHVSALLALSVDGLLPEDDGGTVEVGSDGRFKLNYPVRAFLAEAMQDAHDKLARVHLAAGAEAVGTCHTESVWMRSEADLARLVEVSYGAHQHSIFTAHQMGGCGMGADSERHVVDLEHRVRGFDNLFVVDGSVLPTALGVNPSETIYGLSHRAVRFVGEAVS